MQNRKTIHGVLFYLSTERPVEIPPRDICLAKGVQRLTRYVPALVGIYNLFYSNSFIPLINHLLDFSWTPRYSTMATVTTFELESYAETARPIEQPFGYNGTEIENVDPQESQIRHGLEPADGGSSAWKLLFGAFSFEAILWGEHKQLSTTGR